MGGKLFGGSVLPAQYCPGGVSSLGFSVLSFLMSGCLSTVK